MNGFIVFMPYANPHIPQMSDAGGWTAWLGATIFEFGAICALLEAWNRDNTVDFGWAVQQIPPLHDAQLENGSATSAANSVTDSEGNKPPERKWIWFSTNTNYWHELGFLAAFVQLCGAVCRSLLLPASYSQFYLSLVNLLDCWVWCPFLLRLHCLILFRSIDGHQSPLFKTQSKTTLLFGLEFTGLRK